MKSRNKSHQVISNHIVSAQIGSLVVISCELMDEQSPFMDHIGCVMQFELTHDQRSENAKRKIKRQKRRRNSMCFDEYSLFTHRSNSNKPIHALLIATQKLFLCKRDGERIMSTSGREKWFDSIGMTAQKLTMRKWIEKKGCSIHLKREKMFLTSFFLKNDLIHCGDINEFSYGAVFFHFFSVPAMKLPICSSFNSSWKCLFLSIAIRRSQCFFSLSKRIETAFNCQLNLMAKNNSSFCERILTEWFANFRGEKVFKLIQLFLIEGNWNSFLRFKKKNKRSVVSDPGVQCQRKVNESCIKLIHRLRISFGEAREEEHFRIHAF